MSRPPTNYITNNNLTNKQTSYKWHPILPNTHKMVLNIQTQQGTPFQKKNRHNRAGLPSLNSPKSQPSSKRCRDTGREGRSYIHWYTPPRCKEEDRNNKITFSSHQKLNPWPEDPVSVSSVSPPTTWTSQRREDGIVKSSQSSAISLLPHWPFPFNFAETASSCFQLMQLALSSSCASAWNISVPLTCNYNDSASMCDRICFYITDIILFRFKEKHSQVKKFPVQL